MADEVRLGTEARGKLREFWAGFGLAVLTLGLYELWWYYRLNDELRSVGRLLGDRKLATSLPLVSASAVALGLVATASPDDVSMEILVAACVAFVASLVSQYRFGRRIRLAEERLGVVKSERFRPVAILLLFPGGMLLIPYFLWFAYVTRHQNALLVRAEDLPRAAAAPA